jgi:tripartite-type tricarboxylate transporter receptor subunit TctC
LQEAGVPNQESDLLIGLVAPVGTPASIVTTLHDQIGEIVRLPDVKSTLDTVSFHPVASSSSEYAEQIKDDITVWGKVMKDANIPVN